MMTDNSKSQLESPGNNMPSESNSFAATSVAASSPDDVESPIEESLPGEPDLEMNDQEADEINAYRSVCRSAVAAVILMILSLMAFSSPLLIFLPLAALVLGLMARSNIKRYPDELVGAKPALLAIIGSIIITVGAVTFHTYVRLTEVPDGYRRVSWGELQPDPAQPFAMVSKTAKELAGEQVFIKGYVYPNEDQTNLRAFILVRDKGTCCFGGQPKPTDMIYVKLDGDLRVNYSWRQRNLGGIFSIDDVANQRVGKLQQIGKYRLTADHLK